MGNFIFGEMQAEETQTASAYEERKITTEESHKEYSKINNIKNKLEQC